MSLFLIRYLEVLLININYWKYKYMDNSQLEERNTQINLSYTELSYKK